ncbi:MAG: hypothetical protein RLP09_21405 [Sandaracinaceae bacterium]
MLRIHSLGALCLVLVLAGGCRREGTPRGDASLSRDAAQMDADAGRGDAGSGDGGGDIDAGDDAGVVDGDGGAMDGGAMDGSMADGGVTDGGVDAGPVSMPCTPTGSCDPFDPSSCPSGQKCAVSDMGTVCEDLTADPALVAGEACTRDSQCGPGTWCVNFGSGFECAPMCAAGSIGDCGADGACIGRVGMEACVQVCRPIAARCDIYAQDCADAAEACTLASHPETGERYTGCRPEGTQTVGQPCGGSMGTCAGGLICIREAGASTCREVCRDPGPPSCTQAGETCSGTARSWGVTYCR